MNGTQPLKRKFHSLTGRITLPLMHDAFRAVKRNRGAAGVDRQSIGMFEANLEQNLIALMKDLKTRGDFQPLPARRTYIDKGGGQKRPLGIPCVRDRVAQDVLRRLLTPLFEPLFHEQSDGFRPGRSCHDALDMIERFLAAGVMEDGVRYPTTVGTPQGGVLSPLLANIALNFLDWQLDEAGFEITHRARRMRTKSVEKFQDRIRELTVRSHNLDAVAVNRINAVIRGVARDFATTFSTVTRQFDKLDQWLRERLRAMKYKRKSKNDRWRLKNKHLRHLGLLSLSDFVTNLSH